MVTKTYLGITLSANATANGMPDPASLFTFGKARNVDFAERQEGRDRRNSRRSAIAAKRSFLSGM